MLREAETSGETIEGFCRRKGISEVSFYRWRAKYGRLDQSEAKRLKALEAENAKLKKLLAEAILANDVLKEVVQKVTTPEGRRAVIGQMMQVGLAERAAIRWSPWSTHVALYDPKPVARDAELVEQMKVMSLLYPRFGYRRIASMLHESIKRVRRLWSRHGFKLGENRPKRRRSRSNEDERPHQAEHADHVWTYDILAGTFRIEDRLADGSMFRMLCVLDEFTRECLAIDVARTIRAADIIRV
jgi:transposase-like protein